MPTFSLRKNTMKTYTIPDLFDGRISLSPCPQGTEGEEQLDSEIKSLQQQGYQLVISMLTNEEQEKHCLTAESNLCAKYAIQYLNFPIRDEVADSDEKTIQFVTKVVRKIKGLAKNERVLFHCRGGVGRSSMMIALVMARLGYDVDEIFTRITQARGEQAPESEEQLNWVKKLSAKPSI